ncbi:MAG: glutamine synthetase [Gammaproteobacteria bacterium]|nr:glutamine synthetase [Gammaproteobacteria bacterium]
MTPQQLIETIQQSPQQKIKVAITDIDGVLRGKYIHKDKFLSAAESGFGFCNVVFGWDCADTCYDNGAYTGWHTGYPDAEAVIDLSTYRQVPWDHDVAFFLADFSAGEQPLAVCPRTLLKQIIGRAQAAGYHAEFGLEFEFFHFSESAQSLYNKQFTNLEPLTPGMFGYSLLRAGQNRDYFNALMDELGAFNVPIEGLHTETGPGVIEAAILHSSALEAADRAVLFKSSTKEIASRFGMTATFMAKIDEQLPGCSGHLHQSLWDAAGQKNLFHDDSDADQMSATFKHYLAGQLHCMSEILPLYAPTVNSYKRLVEGMWAPTLATWGVDNRTAALRAITGGAKSSRLETRVGGADINPYLAVAAALASGLWGIEQKLELKEDAVSGNAYQAQGRTRLPRNLLEATEKMAASDIAKTLFGVDHFVRTRLWEWQQYERSVSSWERQRYLEII